MLPAERQRICSERASDSKEELLDLLVKEIDKNQALEARLSENEKVTTRMAEDYAILKVKYADSQTENTELKKQNEHLTAINGLQAKALFGRSSEKSADIPEEEIPGDPLSEDADTAETEQPDTGNKSQTDSSDNSGSRSTSGGHSGHQKHSSGKHGHRGRKPMDLSRLPVHTTYDLDAARIDELNHTYGKGKWVIKLWRHHDKVERPRASVYVERTYEPIIAHGNTYDLEALPYPTDLLPGSILSVSLATSLMYGKFGMGLPFEREIKDLETDGLFLTEQTVTFWSEKLAEDYLAPVKDFMILCLKGRPYNQCDETTLSVINDGRPAGSRSFVWVHVTSELDDKPPIVVFCYEKTRAALHLTDFYGSHSRVRRLTCDAYSAYPAFEKIWKKAGKDMEVTCCWMHSRRRYSNSLVLINKKKLSEEQILDLLENRALKMIGTIYHQEGRLKTLTAAQRLAQRQKKIKPLVDEYFTFVHSFDPADPALGEKLRDALNYSINQEDRLRAFLSDGTIPIDDGFTERLIRPFASGRRSWLFNYTPRGARAAMIYYTLLGTARLNDANPYIYLQYLFEKMPELVPFRTGQKDMRKMMPWSAEYRQYEKSELGRIRERYLPEDDEKPASPKMARKKKSA